MSGPRAAVAAVLAAASLALLESGWDMQDPPLRPNWKVPGIGWIGPMPMGGDHAVGLLAWQTPGEHQLPLIHFTPPGEPGVVSTTLTVLTMVVAFRTAPSLVDLQIRETGTGFAYPVVPVELAGTNLWVHIEYPADLEYVYDPFGPLEQSRWTLFATPSHSGGAPVEIEYAFLLCRMRVNTPD